MQPRMIPRVSRRLPPCTGRIWCGRQSELSRSGGGGGCRAGHARGARRHWQDRRPDDPAAYAFRAVSLNAIKRRTRRRPIAPLEAAETAPARETAAAPLDSLEFERAIARLPVAQQVVVRMRFYLGYSLAQISRSLSISSNTAASRCRYALATLRTSLKGHWHSTETRKEIDHGNEV